MCLNLFLKFPAVDKTAPDFSLLPKRPKRERVPRYLPYPSIAPWHITRFWHPKIGPSQNLVGPAYADVKDSMDRAMLFFVQARYQVESQVIRG
jgi:hypothetical protein